MQGQKIKVLIKGAGDLASGIACRLHQCGFCIVMTDIAVPTTVRRTVAFSKAVYEGQAVVEGISGFLCGDIAQIDEVTAQNNIAVIVDEACQILNIWKPDVVVDAILAKKNLGTAITDARIVIGAGPGFTAGTDCHAVVETKRGHDLGRCIWQGGAIPDTGVPGIIGGYGKERIIRATSDGIFRGTVKIGSLVKQGELLGYAGTEPIYAEISGIVRGLLQDGVSVIKGMKSGDIDPRAEAASCFTVSDKARAISGGVLEGILHLMIS